METSFLSAPRFEAAAFARNRSETPAPIKRSVDTRRVLSELGIVRQTLYRRLLATNERLEALENRSVLGRIFSLQGSTQRAIIDLRRAYAHDQELLLQNERRMQEQAEAIRSQGDDADEVLEQFEDLPMSSFKILRPVSDRLVG